MRSALASVAQRRAGRSRSTSLSAVPPAQTSNDYLPEHAAIAASILYRSPLPSKEGRPIYVLNAAAFPDAFDVDYDSLLSYVLARLPGEDELLSGTEYEIVFFAGGQPDSATAEKRMGPGMGWYLQAYHILSRATRKKLQRLYIVHPRTWVRVLIGVFGTIVSPKFRRKIIHINTLSQLALQMPIDKLLIPPAVYLHDRKLSPDIEVPYAGGRRAFGARHPLPKNINTGETRLPRVLRETSSFVLSPTNVETEGIFRIPPHSVLAGVLREAYTRGQQFIVWKEKGVTLVQPGIEQQLVDEVRLEDAYGVHMAAGLIKSWYRELREPIFAESTYEQLREKYSTPDTEVTPEDLVDLLLPASPTSPLSPTAREILTRHLLPLLSAVAQHEPQNKMTPENLAICFSMCLVCGSNQLEDAKMSSIVKRILQAATDLWPQLRDGMGIDARAFEKDIQPPPDIRDYEDPPEVEPQQRSSEDDAIEGHRVIMTDNDERAPPLPTRPRATSAAKKLLSLEITSPLKRKPAPTTADSAPPVMAPALIDLPRYSNIFDTDGQSLHVEDSPASYSAPADGFGPARRGESYNADEKRGYPIIPPPAEPHPALNIPKRKAVSADTPANSAAVSRSISDGSNLLAKLAAQKAAAGLAQRLTSPASPFPDFEAEPIVTSPESVLSEGDGVFRKPSLPASATRHTQPAPQKPALPPRQSPHSQTLPSLSSHAAGNGLTAPSVPKPRAPSPGLLKRMSSIEKAPSKPAASAALQPQRMDLKKASVDDLRRLYEERVSTAQGLAQAEAARRGS